MPIDFDILSEPRITSETALEELRTAWNAAQSCELDPWEFAVGIGALFRAGVTETELRYLLAKGLAERANEATRPNDTTRRFRSVKSLALDTSACFVITDEGRRPAARKSDARARKNANDRQKRRVANKRSSAVPFWDNTLRELRLEGKVIKRFTRPALAQEIVLAALQEEGWVPVIDDPLPVHNGLNPKRRLKETVKRLNGAQHPHRIHFSTTGAGTSVTWKIVGQTSPPDRPLQGD